MRKFGSSEVRKCGSSEVWKCGSAEVRKCGSAEVRKCGSAEVGKYGSWKGTNFIFVCIVRRERSCRYDGGRSSKSEVWCGCPNVDKICYID